LVYDVTIPDGETVNVVFEVLAATRPSQVGKTFSEKLSGEKASGKLLNLALATRIITPAEREAARNGPFDLADDRILMMKSRQLCGKVTMQRKQRQNPATGQWEDDPTDPRSFAHINFDSYDVASDKARDIPKSQQFLAMMQGRPAASVAPSVPGAAAAATPAAAPSMKW
jgi:hypothetical protein